MSHQTWASLPPVLVKYKAYNGCSKCDPGLWAPWGQGIWTILFTTEFSHWKWCLVQRRQSVIILRLNKWILHSRQGCQLCHLLAVTAGELLSWIVFPQFSPLYIAGNGDSLPITAPLSTFLQLYAPSVPGLLVCTLHYTTQNKIQNIQLQQQTDLCFLEPHRTLSLVMQIYAKITVLSSSEGFALQQVPSGNMVT